MKTFFAYVTNTLFFLVIGLGALAGTFLLAREYFLWQGIRSFRSDLLQAHKQLETVNCGETQEEGFAGLESFSSGSYPQLRFIDSRTYVIEVVCAGSSGKTVEQETKTLPSFVSKIKGAAGVVIRDDISSSMVGLAVFSNLVDGLPPSLRPWLGWISRGELLGHANGNIMTRPVPPEGNQSVAETFGVSPVTSCEGYGFRCCDGSSQQGVGDSIENVPNCQGNCFSTCRPRPVIASWRTDPMPDWQTNILEVSNGTKVTFYYVIQDDPSNGPWKAMVDFGDGENQDITGSAVPPEDFDPDSASLEENQSQQNAYGKAEHVYSCSSELCTYVATVTAQNASGVTSQSGSQGKIEVRVRNTNAVQSTAPLL